VDAEGRFGEDLHSPSTMTIIPPIVKIWGCLAVPERCACNLMQANYGAGTSRARATLRACFIDNLPAGYSSQRRAAWEANFDLHPINVGTEEEPDFRYFPTAQWCEDLYICRQSGACSNPPNLCDQLVIYGQPGSPD
jgi:hypothetical protein